MQIPIYQVDAFSTVPFSGNPAAVCPLDAWLPKEYLQAIAQENCLSETAFFVARDHSGEYDLRWFTPNQEVDLCGHATLATSHVLFQELGVDEPMLHFHTKSGELIVRKLNQGYEMDFPAVPTSMFFQPLDLPTLIGVEGRVIGRAMDVLVRVESEADVRALKPNMAAIATVPARGLIVTAPGDDEGVDFVSRFFAPQAGVPEDPVTGSAHCTLAPYWAKELGKNSFFAQQIGPRGGELHIRLEGTHVLLMGQAVTVIKGHIYLPDSL
ncbi:MAG: PhzF family phenazine biosynthesis protein [Bacteroidia bacterium]|nr:PhzF family phenazine biosynthesis protein [Bacteroidia bacterium]